MHIKCKCGFRLTNKELFLTKKWRNTGETDYQDFPIFEILLGSFINDKHWWSRRPIVRVNRDDLTVGVVPIFEQGLGCCDVNINVRCPQCKSEIGGASYDCYVTRRSVSLVKLKINVTHKTNKQQNKNKLSAFDEWSVREILRLQNQIDNGLYNVLLNESKTDVIGNMQYE